MAETFESLLVKLSRSGVEFLVAGGVAVCLNGYVRTTQDLDILVAATPENLRRLLDCLAHFGQGFARELSLEDFPIEEGAVRVAEDFSLDIFTVMRSRTYADYSHAARSLELHDTVIRYLAPAALIELKCESSREKDQLDVAVLRRILSGAERPNAADLERLTSLGSGLPDNPEQT
jgi:hypothetical protein